MENISLVKMEMTTFKSIASFSEIFLSVYIMKIKISPSFSDQGKYLVLQADRKSFSLDKLQSCSECVSIKCRMLMSSSSLV